MSSPPRFVRIFPLSSRVDHPLDEQHQWNELYFCPKCGGLEASLMEYCPMVRLTTEELNLIYRLYVEDCTFMEPVSIHQYNSAARRYNDELLDGMGRNRSTPVCVITTGQYST